MMTPFPGPRSVLILDNARIHHAEEIEALVHYYGMFHVYSVLVLAHRQPGCRLEFLPPYSPDYNPIEQAFSIIKSYLRCCGLSFYHDMALYYEMYRSCDTITAEMTWGFFRHSGYL